MFGLLADVEGSYRPVVAHHPRPDLTQLAFAVIQEYLRIMCFVSVHYFAPFVVRLLFPSQSISRELPLRRPARF